MALQCRHDQIAQQKRDQPNHHQLIHRSSSGESAKSSSDPSDRDRDCHHRSSRDYDRDRDRDRDRYWDRDQDSKRRRVLREEQMSREQVRLEKLAEQEREKELEVIKEQYLGSKKSKKRVIKPSEKFRFSFDWENTEDTSRDMNSLYQNPHEARLLFGRGFCSIPKSRS